MNLGTSITVDFDTLGRRYVEFCEDLQTDAAVPKNCLHGQVVDTEGFAQFGVCYSLVQREAIREEGDEEVADGPVLNIFIKNDLVAKDDDLEFTLLDQSVENVATRLTSGLAVQSADTNLANG